MQVVAFDILVMSLKYMHMCVYIHTYICMHAYVRTENLPKNGLVPTQIDVKSIE